MTGSAGDVGAALQLVEVGLRDGLQPIPVFVPTTCKIALLQTLHASGLRRFELTSFANPKAVPQLADASEMIQAAADLPGLHAQVLVPTARQAERALAAGAHHLAFVLSASDAHNTANVARSTAASLGECRSVVAMLEPGAKLRINVATAFDCPFAGVVTPGRVLGLIRDLADLAPVAEIALCDTTGRAGPAAVASLFDAVRSAMPGLCLAFHGHDTFGMGVVNVWAAWTVGVRVIDSSVGGLGGCPFAPGATGNVATEDVVWMFEGAGVPTGIDLGRLIDAAGVAASLDGARPGGRVRDALAAHERYRVGQRAGAA